MLPEGWFRILLDPEHREQSVSALLERQFKGVDDAPHMRRMLRKELLDRAVEAFTEGGIELYISLQSAGALTIPASLLITLIPPREHGSTRLSPQDLAADFRGEGVTVSTVEMAAGTAVRRRLDPEAAAPARTHAEGDDYALPSVTVDYQLPVPHSDMYLLLTFSTPLVQIADAMTELFDAIAGSLVWKED